MFLFSFTVLASRARVTKNDLGKVSRKKKIFIFLTPCWCQSRARVGARAEVTKNDLGKVSNEPHFWKRWGVLAIILNLLK